MMKFDLAGFAGHLATLPIAMMVEQHVMLEHAATIIEHAAKEEIGNYQEGSGPFAAWAPLAETTLEGWHGYPGKIDLGYSPPDNPLLRTGELRDSISHEAGEAEAIVGSNSLIAVWQEMGTSRMPPRSFLGIAAGRNGEHIAGEIGGAIVAVLAGGGVKTRI